MPKPRKELNINELKTKLESSKGLTKAEQEHLLPLVGLDLDGAEDFFTLESRNRILEAELERQIKVNDTIEAENKKLQGYVTTTKHQADCINRMNIIIAHLEDIINRQAVQIKILQQNQNQNKER